MSESLSDDYVADLLKKDARDSNIKFSSLGLYNSLPTRPTTAAPKPNTRFLRNIIRETDNHNASLLVRGTEQSRSRLRALKTDTQHQGSVQKSRSHDEHHRKRRRVNDHEREQEHGRNHRHNRNKERVPHRRGRSRERETSLECTGRKGTHEPEGSEEYSSRRRSNGRDKYRSHSEDSIKQGGERHRRKRHHGGHHHRSRLSSSDGERNAHHRSRRKKTTQSPTASSYITYKHHHDRQKIKASSPQHHSSHRSDSDPLDAVIGPAPPPKIRARGRGAFATSAMDSHFSSTYDPSVDVQSNPESEDDWDQALEALRDRQRWKQQGAQRLRSAGFTHEEVEKWEKGGEKREEDVRWTRPGERREWDRGKVVGAEGEVDVKPEWPEHGRLKGV